MSKYNVLNDRIYAELNASYTVIPTLNYKYKAFKTTAMYINNKCPVLCPSAQNLHFLLLLLSF